MLLPRPQWYYTLVWTAYILQLRQLPSVQPEVFTLGYITGTLRRPWDKEYPRPGLSISGAISLAVNEVKKLGILPAGHELDFEVAETYGEETESILQTARLWTRNVSAYIGPQETCVTEARMAAAFQLPMISYFCTHYETSNKKFFPTFARTRPPDTQISKSVASVLLHFGWKKVAFFYKNSEDEEYSTIAATITSTLKEADIQVKFKKAWNLTYHHGYLDNPFQSIVEETYQDIRIYVVLGHYYEHIGLLVAMEDRKLFDKGEYFVVGVDIERYDAENPDKYLRGLLKNQPDDKVQRAYKNYIGVVGSPPVDFENFTVDVNEYMEKPPFNFPNPLTVFGAVKTIRAEAAYLYDAVMLYAYALRDVLNSGGDPLDGITIIERMKDRTYRSVMGYVVYMDEDGDAQGNYTLIARQPHHTSPYDYGLYPIGVFQLAENHSKLPELRVNSTIVWTGGQVPVDEPPCGFRGDLCISYTAEIAGAVVGGLLFLLGLVILAVYRNWRYEQELDSLLWKIDYKDLQIPEMPTVANSNGQPSSKVLRSSHPLLRSSQVSLSSNPDADFRYSAIYSQIGVYRGRIFAVKRVNKKYVDLTREMKKELKAMRDLRHENLVAFIGACVDPPNICIITEYCTRGSLKDILHNEDVKLDNMYIASLVGDVIRGMIYLHESSIRSHGKLKSCNCLVDSRWMLKIGDYGLHGFKAGAEEPMDEIAQQKLLQDLLYQAPELLRDLDPPSHGTPKGDVYSFAMILYEIHSRSGPFGSIAMPTEDILLKVKAYPTLQQPPFRPQIELLDNCFDCVRLVLRECWSESPEDRPDFKSLRSKLRPMRKGLRPNILDNMMAMMEKYANNLEALVDERTEQLTEEKKKTEALLYEMLPRYVAEQLKRGHKVEAESFDCVTIYFSDIVGFTAMSAESTALEIVNFLNDLYTCFDSIIENYDVYKVETIGDAYMVVSGMPIRNGDQHAAEIASMSLSLLRAVVAFKIRHRPQDTLKLRVGIHSGPVCAGVVGLKMPRYCLFGDTVNTASRMESTGLPLKIHCSFTCQKILEKLGGYQLEERGLVKMKGKGDVLTYWLDGETAELQLARSQNPKRVRINENFEPILGFEGFVQRNCGPRSSLKNTRLDLGRTVSLDSPKKLRFANQGFPADDNTHVTAADRSVMSHHPVTVSVSAASSPSHPPLNTAISYNRLNVKRNSCPCMDAADSMTSAGEMQHLLPQTKEELPQQNKALRRLPRRDPNKMSTTSLLEAIAFSAQAQGVKLINRKLRDKEPKDKNGQRDPYSTTTFAPTICLSPPDNEVSILNPRNSIPALETSKNDPVNRNGRISAKGANYEQNDRQSPV